MIRAQPAAPKIRRKKAPKVGGPINSDSLQGFIARIENVETDQEARAKDKRSIYDEAKLAGYNPKIMRKIVAERKRDGDAHAAEEAELATYRHALGMAVELVRGGLSLRKAAEATGASKSSIQREIAVPTVSQESVPHDPATGEVIEINPEQGEDGTAKPVGQSSPPEAPQTADLDTLPGDGEASADERDASASSSPPILQISQSPIDLTLPAFLDRRSSLSSRGEG